MEIVAIAIWAVMWLAGWAFIFWMTFPKEKDFCPRIYKGYTCHRKASNDGCDHSSRVWALMGIDLDELTTQPYIGDWSDPLRERKNFDGREY